MSKGKIDYTVPSSEFRKDGLIRGQDGKVLVDINGDSRLQKIEQLVRAEIVNNGWKVPQDEKVICGKISELMHKKEFYGPYSDSSIDHQLKLASVNQQISEIRLNKDDREYQISEGMSLRQLDAKLENLVKQQEELKKELVSDTKSRNIVSLKDVKSGETVCFHQAAIMSHVMDSVGLKNNLCFGVAGADISVGTHVYVQSEEGYKNIIDATKSNVYWYNNNAAEIKKGEVVVVSESPYRASGAYVSSYGGGKEPSASQFKKPDKYLKEQLEQDEPSSVLEKYQSIIHANQSRAEDGKLKLHLPKDVDAEVLRIMESMNGKIFGKDEVSAKELTKGQSKLSEHERQVLEKAGIQFDGKSSYDISEAKSNLHNKPQVQHSNHK